MAIETQAQLFEALAGAQVVGVEKAATTFARVSGWCHYANISSYPSAASTPATLTGTTYTHTSAGAMPLRSAASGTCYIAGIEISVSHAPCIVMVADLLWRNSGMSGTNVASQTVNNIALPRYNGSGGDGGYDGTRAFLEVYSVLGTTSRTLTVNYTDQNDTAGLTGIVRYTGSPRPVARQVMWMETDSTILTGIKSIQSVQWDGSTGTAGNFGMGICRPMTSVHVPTAGQKHFFDFTHFGMIPTLGEGCHTLFATSAPAPITATAAQCSAPYISATVRFIYG